MLQRLMAFARETGALRAGRLYLVGVSGGVDSVALLFTLRELAPVLGIGLHVAHLDHGLRGGESAADAAFVAGLAAQWELPVTVGTADVRALAATRRLSEEAAGRQARYTFFAETAERTDAAGVFVAHTADDQVETVLLHLLRGTGLAGLRGMAAVQPLPVSGGGHAGSRALVVLRPLLGAWRAEVEAFAAERGLTYRDDATNADPRFLRNRVRQELVPLLETYNPALRASLLQLAGLASADYAVLAALADRAWSEVAVEREEGVSLSAVALRQLALALQRLVLRRAFATVAGELNDLEAKHVEAALSLAAGDKAVGRLHLPSGVVATLGYDRLLLSRGEPQTKALSDEGVVLRVPGTTAVEPGGWEAIAEVSDSPCPCGADGSIMTFDLDRVGASLVVRRRRPGDRLRPVGLGGSKKLQDIMVDRKVPRWQRDAVPVVASPARPLWVVGLAVDERALPDAGTKRYLCLRFRRRGTT